LPLELHKVAFFFFMALARRKRGKGERKKGRKEKRNKREGGEGEEIIPAGLIFRIICEPLSET
jgi:hypothetical protein